MESCLYRGLVKHRRLQPVVHDFRYGIFFVYLDLSELDLIFDGRWFWSVEMPNWASFRRSDHLRSSTAPLDRAVREVVESQLGWLPSGPVRMLTHLRYLGYCFNPISIYYCFAENGSDLDAVVCEVHNTPWGEEYLRALDMRDAGTDNSMKMFSLEKEFHVSPFMPMDITCRWVFSKPSEQLLVSMVNQKQGQEVFSASLELERRPFGSANMAGCLLQWPCMTARVITAIYWQAFRLVCKRVPFHTHPSEMKITKGRYNP